MEYNYPDKNDAITSKIINKSKGYQKYWHKSENRILRNIERNLKSNGSFLDVGCGYGRMLEKLEKYFSDIVGIEPDRNRFDKAKENLSSKVTSNKVKLLNIDIEDLNCHKKFDFILCSHVIQHIDTEKAKRIFIKMGELLSENGVIVVMTSHSKIESDYFLETFVENNNIIEKRITEDDFNRVVVERKSLPIRCFSLESIKNMINGTDLEINDWQVYHLENTSYLIFDSIVNNLNFAH